MGRFVAIRSKDGVDPRAGAWLDWEHWPLEHVRISMLNADLGGCPCVHTQMPKGVLCEGHWGGVDGGVWPLAGCRVRSLEGAVAGAGSGGGGGE